ncbi:MAG TPA: 3-isopropylmalate dehydratase small subunit [Spirochaetia bacterium]|nr:3-isopropylmalate dehydratase small subunit [Spirochaetia bacterium]
MSAQSSVRKLVRGKAIPLPGDDIDTDRIIPARFLRMITFEELGKYAFIDERVDEAGKPRPHPLNEEKFRGGTILIVNRNFGCGSSREHAPQSLMRMGIEAFVGESFAEIFSGNCTALGLPAVRVSHEDALKLQSLVESDPSIELTVDLEAQTVCAGASRFSFSMPDSDRKSLVSGTWDSTAMLLANEEAIGKTAARIPYLNGFAGAKGGSRG